MNALLTKLEAAKFLQISPSTLDRLRKANAFPAPAPSYKVKPLLWSLTALNDFRCGFKAIPPEAVKRVPMRKLRAVRKGGAR